MTGGRIKRVKDFIGKETFCLTYGDGLSDVNIKALIQFHKNQKCLATLTAVQPPGRFGAFMLDRDENQIKSFKEKPKGDGAWINGGFFVLEPEAIDYIENDTTVWEQGPMERMAREGKLAAFRHQGFWQPMDTLRDKNLLEKLWISGQAPWKLW
jgi:glucose-1-phosphate cytidylyltransferase